jgi:hypothetical protein
MIASLSCFGLEVIAEAGGSEYIPTADDDGAKLTCEVVPVRDDGVKGKSALSSEALVRSFEHMRKACSSLSHEREA